VSDQAGCRVAILIVGFRNSDDVSACVTALSRSNAQPDFDIFVCENGGSEAFDELHIALASPQGPCSTVSDDLPEPLGSPSGRLLDVRCLALNGRSSRVWIGRAAQNLGYAGGLNVWINRLLPLKAWNGIWILNPDCEPEPDALDALVKRAVNGNKGMVGSTIVSFEDREHVHCRGGLRWRPLMTRPAIIGFQEPLNAPFDLNAIEAALHCISGASMYVTRACLAKIGPMDERFFLYYEDADWSAQAKQYGLGYASDSIVRHKGGTTIGSAGPRAKRSRLSVYLQSRNHINFVRKHLRGVLPLASIVSFVYAVSYLVAGSSQNFRTALDGLIAGLKSETGIPAFMVGANVERAAQLVNVTLSKIKETARSDA
jgi:N-acetylglucosaminyl-diphospho-decaprenol L-rhamnosyltransferase